jgi:oligosaccharide repeat unit polymerase
LCPEVIVVATFALCTFFSFLYTEVWELPMHVNTICVIVAEILFFFVGAYLGKVGNPFLDFSESLEEKNFVVKGAPYKINTVIFSFLLLVSVFFVFFNYRESMQIAGQFTASPEIGDRLRAIIHGLQDGTISFSRWNSYRTIFLKSLSYVTIYAFIYNLVFFKKHNDFCLLIPTVLYGIAVLWSGGRQVYIYITLYVLVTLFIMYLIRYNYNKKIALRLITIGIIAFIGFLFVFMGIGSINGKINSSMSITRVLAHYIGTNINAFDDFINHCYPSSTYPGSMTLTQFYNKLRIFYSTIPVFSAYNTNFVQFRDINTNVYTALMRYINDYGYLGCTAIMFLLGFISSSSYHAIRVRKKVGYSLILYGSFIYPIFLLCREERFFMGVVSTTSIYFIILSWIIYRYVLEGGVHEKY